jgi:hypothetical protein
MRLPTWMTLPIARTSGTRVGHGAHVVHLQLGGGVGLAGGQRGVHRAADARVEQRGDPAAVHGAERVVVAQPRRPWNTARPGVVSMQREVERVGDRRVRQLAGEHAFEELQAGLAGDLLGPRHAPLATMACGARLIGLPLSQHLCVGLLAGPCVPG